MIVELEMMGCDVGGDGEMESRRNVLKRTVAALRLVRHAEACGTYCSLTKNVGKPCRSTTKVHKVPEWYS